MKLIPLSKFGKNRILNLSVQVDDADYDWLMQWNWCANKVRNKPYYYVIRSTPRGQDGKQQAIYMHREIAGVIDEGMVVDHKDLNRFNCQRDNLRVATKAQNCANKSSNAGSSSKYLGVCKRTLNKKKNTYWRSKVKKYYKVEYDQLFPYTPCGELLAAINYDINAEKIHGEFANLNFKPLK